MEVNKNFSDKVKFHPWVGKEYHCGIKGYDTDGKIMYGTVDDPGLKILVLYFPFVRTSYPEDIKVTVTQDQIRELIDPDEDWKPIHNYYNHVIRALTGIKCGDDNWEHEVRENAWNHIAFYQYCQVLITDALNGDLMNVDFKNSEEAFHEVLQKLRPDLVIVKHPLVQDQLKRSGKLLDKVEIVVNDIFQTKDSLEIWSYNTIPMMFVTLDATYYVERFNRFIKAFINKFKNKETWK